MKTEELREILSVQDWESCTIEQLAEQCRLEYDDIVGLADLQFANHGAVVYVRYERRLVQLTLHYFDVWRELDGGWVCRSYNVSVDEQVFPT